MKEKIALIGVNGFGRFHLNHLLTLHDAGTIELVAAVVRNREKAAEAMPMLERIGCRIFPDEDSLYAAMANELDLVCIPTGINFHCPMTVKALRNRVNVLVEKPAAGSVADVQAMIEAEKNAPGKFVAVAFQHPYSQEIQEIKRRILSGKYGKLKRIAVKGVWPRDDSYYYRNAWVGKCRNEKGDAIFDSPINNAFAHYLNIALFVSGEEFGKTAKMTDVKAELYRVRPELETFDTCAVAVETEPGVHIQCLFSHASDRTVSPVVRFECEKASFFWSHTDEKGFWKVVGADGVEQEYHPFEARRIEVFEYAARHVHDDKSFIYTLENALEQTRCIELMHNKCKIMPVKKSAYTVGEKGQHILKNVVEVFDRCDKDFAMPSAFSPDWV